MDAKTQVLVLFFSYFFGFSFFYLAKLNRHIIKNQKKIYRSFITILFIYNIVLIYIISIYKINTGIFHIYFFLMIILGFISCYFFTKKMKNNVKYREIIEKAQKKCYTKKNRNGTYGKKSN